MPGSSLWLIPPRSPFNSSLETLINTTIPSHFSGTKTHPFIPHITLTSNIPTSTHGQEAQQWLDSLPFSQGNLSSMRAAIESIDPGVPFFKKLTLRIGRDPALLALAAVCRSAGVTNGDEQKARAWAENEYLPHLSLMYAELDIEDVERRKLAMEEDLRKVRSQLNVHGESEICKGACIVLVPTDKPINEWQPIAQRELPHLEWAWP